MTPMKCPKCEEETSTKETHPGYYCEECKDEVTEIVKRYECAGCGNIFKEEDAEGSHSCPECHKWGHIQVEQGCPDCESEEELSLRDLVECDKCGEAFPLEEAEEGDQPGKPHTPALNDYYAKFKDGKVTDLIQVLTVPKNRKQPTSSVDYLAVVISKGVFRMDLGDGDFWISGHNSKGSFQLHDFGCWTFVKRDLVDKTLQAWNVDARLEYARDHSGEVDLYRCPQCCNVELFKPGEFEADEKSDKPLKRYSVYCPLCLQSEGRRDADTGILPKLEKVKTEPSEVDLNEDLPDDKEAN